MKKIFVTLKEICKRIQKTMNCGKNFREFQKLKIAKTYLAKFTSYLLDFNNHYLENDVENLHL